MGDMWNAPGDDTPRGPSALPGGDPQALSDPMSATNAVIADVKDNLVPYLLCGLSFVTVFTLVTSACVAVPFVGILPGVIAEDELLLALGSVFGFVAYMLMLLAAIVIVYPLMAASTLRGIDQQLRGGPRLGLMSPVNDMFSGAGRVVALYALGTLLTLVGMLFFYVPGLIVAVLMMFAMPMVVLEGAGPIEAMKRGWGHMLEHPSWHLPVWLLMFIGSAAMQLTIVGILFVYPVMLAYHLVAYRIAFGDPGPGGGVTV
ncbi:MAG TPA: hypothetical protein ENK18_08765 [Deltaproteobacteria bacterium]|nr:hypothetical protein [Deltaproteobacteria bacterium]